MPDSIVTTDQLAPPLGPVSHGLRLGNVIRLASTAGTLPDGRPAGQTRGRSDVTAQSEQLLQNVRTALGLLGGRPEDVVRLKGYLTDFRHFEAYNEVYVRHYPPPYPCRATVSSAAFPLLGTELQVELTAVLGGDNRHLTSDRLPPTTAPYAQGGSRAADVHYCALVALGPDGRLVGPADVAAQTTRALTNIATAIDVAGLGLRDLVMLTITLADPRDYEAFEVAFHRFFDPPYPARAVVITKLGHPDYLVEVESIAVAGGGQPVRGLGQPTTLGAASPAMLAGDTLYVSGQFGLDADGSLPAGLAAQAGAVRRRIEALLDEAGLERGDLVWTSNAIAHHALFAPFAAETGEPGRRHPPGTTVQAALLDPRAAFQVAAIASRGGRHATILSSR